MTITSRFLAVALIATTITASPAFAGPDLAKGKEIYDQRCATCHGPLGAGDGPVAMALPPESKPRNLQEGKFKFAVDDDKMKLVIKEGGAAHGLNPLMPAQADLSDADLASVIGYIHSLKK